MIPQVTTEDELTALKADLERSAEVLRPAAGALGFDPAELTVVAEGSALVGRVGSTFIKGFAPFDRSYAETERRVLQYLTGRLSIPTPEFWAATELEGWQVIAMGAIDGAPLSTVWGRLDRDTQARLCRELGAVIAELHSLDPSALADLEPQWQPWIAEQRAGAVERQRSLGLEASWLDQIEPFLARTDPLRSEEDPRRVLLHTEVMREHVFVMERAGRWELTGLLDFEPAMVGTPTYEFASVGLFVSAGDSGLFRAFCSGYGFGERSEFPRDFPLRCLRAKLLHRYAHLPWVLRRLEPKSTDLDDLASEWWGTD